MRPPPEAPPPDVSELLSADGQQDQQVAMGGDAQPCGSSSGAEAADSESAPLAPSATPAAALSADHRGEGGGVQRRRPTELGGSISGCAGGHPDRESSWGGDSREEE